MKIAEYSNGWDVLSRQATDGSRVYCMTRTLPDGASLTTGWHPSSVLVFQRYMALVKGASESK